MSIDRLCFGTSTFAAGRLRPDIDSAPGIAALRDALVAGVRLVHSNPNLGTQWAIREALTAGGHPDGVRHLIKVSIPLDVDEDQARQAIRCTLEISRKNLGTDHIAMAIVEPDLKRTRCGHCLVDYEKIAHFYESAAEHILKTGQAQEVYAFCPSPGYLEASLHASLIAGCTAHYNLIEAWPALHLDHLARAGRGFAGVSPLQRGALIDRDSTTSLGRLRPLRWAIGHPAVSVVVVATSSPDHLSEILLAARNPLPVSAVDSHARSWGGAGSISPNREK